METTHHPSVVYTQVNKDGIQSQNIMLGPRQKAQWIGTVCAQIEYQIYGSENASLQLLLSNSPNGYLTVINVKLLPSEPGFVLITNSSTSMMKCDCSPFLTSSGVICDTSDGTVTRNKLTGLVCTITLFQLWLKPLNWTTAIVPSRSCL